MLVAWIMRSTPPNPTHHLWNDTCGAQSLHTALVSTMRGRLSGLFRTAAGFTTASSTAAVASLTIDVPGLPPFGTNRTEAYGINSAGRIVGVFEQIVDDVNTHHGFLDNGGSFTTIDVPGADQTSPWGINDRGQIVGEFLDSTGFHGFLDSSGSFTTIDVPGADQTHSYDINDRGQIVGGFPTAQESP